MTRSPARGRAAWLVLSFCALPWSALALSDAPAEREPEAWAPALAAWGARAGRGAAGGAADAPALAISSASRSAAPALGAAGQGSTGAIADHGAPRTPETETRDETERWIPGFALYSGILGQDADASIKSDSTVTYNYTLRESVGGGPSFSPTTPIIQRVTRSLTEHKSNTVGFLQTGPSLSTRSLTFLPNSGAWSTGPPPFPRLPTVTVAFDPVLPAQGSTTFLTPFSSAALEIMTPGLQGVPGRPRAFAHGGAGTAFSFTRNVAKEGIPGPIQFPAPAARVGEGEVKGIGSKTAGTVKTPVFSAGIGPAFTLDAFERRLRIKPSVEWMRQEFEVTGRLVRVYRKDTGKGSSCPGGVCPPASSFFLQEPIDIKTSDTKTFHGIGPGLEVEMDAGRAGPVVMSLFVAGQAYYMLGDREVHLVGTDTISDPVMVPTEQTVSADFDFNIHQWSYQGGLGVRFRWVPED
jgi:hypothetical protein